MVAGKRDFGRELMGAALITHPLGLGFGGAAGVKDGSRRCARDDGDGAGAGVVR